MKRGIGRIVTLSRSANSHCRTQPGWGAREQSEPSPSLTHPEPPPSSLVPWFPGAVPAACIQWHRRDERCVELLFLECFLEHFWDGSGISSQGTVPGIDLESVLHREEKGGRLRIVDKGRLSPSGSSTSSRCRSKSRVSDSLGSIMTATTEEISRKSIRAAKSQIPLG